MAQKPKRGDEPSANPKGTITVQPAAGESLGELLKEAAPELLQRASADQKRHLEAVRITTVTAHSGPLPTPEMLERYSQIIPNGAERIMAMAEAQSAHRISIESTVITSQQSQSGRGQVFALTIGIFGITAGAIVACLGHDAVGGTIAGTTVVSLAVAFITGKYSQKADLEAKRPKPKGR